MRVYSMFRSINGEVNSRGQGSLVTFLRLSSCNLKCSYCDTPQAQDFSSGFSLSIGGVMERIDRFQCPYVMITGGEPMVQRQEVEELCKLLRSSGHHVTIETNGTIDITPWCADCWVADVKLPSSGQITEICWDMYEKLTERDFVKFVISDRVDYIYAKSVLDRFNKSDRPCFAKKAFSPMLPGMNPLTLLSWMEEDGLWSVSLNVQLHKLLKLKEDTC